MAVVRRLALALVCGVLTACAAGGPSASPSPAESVTAAMPTTSASPSPTAIGVPTPSPSPITTATATPVPTATPAPATPQATPAPPPALLPPGALVRTTVSGLRLREDTSRHAEVLATIPQGELLFVGYNPNWLSPISADGLDWYVVDWNPDGVPWPYPSGMPSPMKSGVVAAGQDGVAYLELVPVTCGSEAPTLTSIGRMTPYARSVCFGGRTLTIQGDAVDGFGGVPLPGIYEPPWLAHPFGGGNIGGVQNFEAGIVYNYRPGLELPAIDPDGTPVVVTGHFNDPASATCVIEPEGPHSSNPDTAHIYCAERFVATQVSLAEP